MSHDNLPPGVTDKMIEDNAHPPEQIDVMIDIETLGVHYDAAIASIGAVTFRRDHPFEIGAEKTFLRNITLQSNLDAGRKVDGPTIDWWFKQSQAARDALHNPPQIALRRALHEFRNWFNEMDGVSCVWSHGVTFDVVILDDAFKGQGMKTPWHWRDVRDTRTLFDIAELGPGWPPVPLELMGNAHVSLDDAVRQAWVVSRVLEEMQDE